MGLSVASKCYPKHKILARDKHSSILLCSMTIEKYHLNILAQDGIMCQLPSFCFQLLVGKITKNGHKWHNNRHRFEIMKEFAFLMHIFVQLSFSSDRVVTDKKVQLNTDLLKHRQEYLHRKWRHWLKPNVSIKTKWNV